MRNFNRTHCKTFCAPGEVQAGHFTSLIKTLGIGNGRHYNIHIQARKHYKLHKNSSTKPPEVQRTKKENDLSNYTED